MSGMTRKEKMDSCYKHAGMTKKEGGSDENPSRLRFIKLQLGYAAEGWRMT